MLLSMPDVSGRDASLAPPKLSVTLIELEVRVWRGRTEQQESLVRSCEAISSSLPCGNFHLTRLRIHHEYAIARTFRGAPGVRCQPLLTVRCDGQTDSDPPG